MPRKSAVSNSAVTEDPWASRDPRFSQSLKRGLAILGCFTPGQPVLGIADIAAKLGMSRSTTHRYVITLMELGFLEQGRARKYRLSLRVTDLGMSAVNATGLPEQSKSIMEDLRRFTSCATSLVAIDGSDIVYLARLESHRQPINVDAGRLSVGSRVPFHLSPLGRALVAHLPEGEREGTVGDAEGLSKRRRKALLSELDDVAEFGFATNLDQAEGVTIIAVPVFGSEGHVVAAMSLEADSSRITLDEMEKDLQHHLLVAADQLSARLGYHREGQQELALA